MDVLDILRHNYYHPIPIYSSSKTKTSGVVLVCEIIYTKINWVAYKYKKKGPIFVYFKLNGYIPMRFCWTGRVEFRNRGFEFNKYKTTSIFL